MTTKEKVLKKLTSNHGIFVSGEDLAQLCEVSRSAVWKAVQSLESEGYEIEAVTKCGYKLVSAPDIFDSEAIADALRARGKECSKILIYRAIDSTNSEAKRRAVEVGAFRNADGTMTDAGAQFSKALFVAETQTSGRGRMGRAFVSSAGSGVYFSLLYAPKNGIRNPALFTAAAAVAVCRAVRSLYDVSCGIKWVNDVFLGGKKIVGILTEGITNFETEVVEAAVVGIGINIRAQNVSGDLAKIIGSIEEFCAAEKKSVPMHTKNVIVAAVVAELLAFYEAFESEDFEKIAKMMDEYKKSSILIGKKVKVNPVAGMSGASFSAVVKDISDEANLIVETEDGTRKELYSGEVSLHSYDFV